MFVCIMFATELAVEQYENRYNAKRYRMLLLLWTVSAALLYVGHYVFFSPARWLIPYTDTVYTACNLLVYPLYLIYIDELTTRSPRQKVWLRSILTVALAAAAIVGWLYYAMSPEETEAFLEHELNHCSSMWECVGSAAALSGKGYALEMVRLACRLLFTVEVVITVVFGSMKIRRFNRLVDDLYADTEGKHMHNIVVLLHLLLVIGLLSLLFNIIGRAQFRLTYWLTIPSLSFAVLLFAVCHTSFHQHFSISDIVGAHTVPLLPQPDAMQQTDDDAKDEQDVTNRDNELTMRLRQVVEKEQIFLQPNLKLDDLARRLNTNRTYLLRTMREDLGMTFSEYINRQRINYARRLMQQYPDLSRADIAERSGYASISSFYRCLKRIKSEGNGV